MPNPIISFSFNRNNKLLCPVKSTIRLRNDRKYQVGALYDITYHKEVISTDTILSIQHFTLDKLTENMARIDTGYSAEQCADLIRKMYSASKLDWNVQQLSFIMLASPMTQVRYIIPTALKLTDRAANLTPEPTLFTHTDKL